MPERGRLFGWAAVSPWPMAAHPADTAVQDERPVLSMTRQVCGCLRCCCVSVCVRMSVSVSVFVRQVALVEPHTHTHTYTHSRRQRTYPVLPFQCYRVRDGEEASLRATWSPLIVCARTVCALLDGWALVRASCGIGGDGRREAT